MAKTKILIADDQPLIRDGLAAILSMEDDFSVVAKTGDGQTTIEHVRLYSPQLVIMDIHMPKLDGLQATKQIKADFPQTNVLILTTFEDEEYIWEAICHGASGFIVKGVATEKLISTVRDCLEGRINYPSSIQKRLAQTVQLSESKFGQAAAHTTASRIPDRQARGDDHFFTFQERNLIRMLKQGKSNQAIASEMLLTKGTVKNYLTALYKKLKVANRAEAIVYIHETGL